ncbi:MAG: hypothetical protein IFK94_15960 [Acidobacteria bacterium]|uniref:Uncharacterized protein n=1 Tax=Candidatus Polarisedimenticola svalbardensis TaxID=2886004 RepID=A0A8J7C3U3_9BACT|nr:hypothetical protein [Candidatus Polarisedimenticola svalbardensis]
MALQRDYGRLDSYVAPNNPHPDSILWRSRYEPPNERGDNCHRGAVVRALLGAENGIPERWISGLKAVTLMSDLIGRRATT